MLSTSVSRFFCLPTCLCFCCCISLYFSVSVSASLYAYVSVSFLVYVTFCTICTYTCICIYPRCVSISLYAGIAMQVLQHLSEFDAPAMQSCKPLPCGTGSCQNRRLREQTVTRKPCHCGSIKGGWCMELPTSLDQPLQGQIVCACLDMFLPV